MGLLLRQAVAAALTANALRPVPGQRTAMAVFVAGWLTGELAPQLMAATLADAARGAWRDAPGPRRTAGLSLAALNAAALAAAVGQAQASRALLDRELAGSLGADWEREGGDPGDPAEPFPWRHLLRPFRLSEPGVRVERDVQYTIGGSRARLDIYRPERLVHDAPVLVQVHGGAWVVGSKEHQGLALMNRMARRGWVCVAPNYRLAPRHPWPAQLVDVKRALAWVREHIADYGGDPSHVAVTGGSAGGHLAAMTALTPQDPAFQPGFEEADTSVRACVPLYGVYDLAAASGLASARVMRDAFLQPRVFPHPFHVDPATYERASPLLRVTADAPDFLVLHGRSDSLVEVEQARRFVAELRRTSAHSVTYAELPGTQHAFDTFWSVRSLHVVDAVDRWLRWQHARAGHR